MGHIYGNPNFHWMSNKVVQDSCELSKNYFNLSSQKIVYRNMPHTHLLRLNSLILEIRILLSFFFKFVFMNLNLIFHMNHSNVFNGSKNLGLNIQSQNLSLCIFILDFFNILFFLLNHFVKSQIYLDLILKFFLIFKALNLIFSAWFVIDIIINSLPFLSLL